MSLKKQDLIDLYTFNTTTLSKEVSDKLLLKSGRGGVSASRDYIRANAILAEYFKATNSRDLSNIESVDDLFKALHPSTIFRLKHYTPCLAARYDELKPAQQAELFDNPDYVATEKENGCFNYDALVTLADGSTMKIGEIVHKKLPVEVLSYNVETGKIEPKRVVNWFYNGFKGKGNWMSISDDESRRSAFKITKTHRVFSEGEFKEVKDVKTLTKLVEINSEINYGLLYNYTPESLVECDFEGGSYDIEVEDNHNYFVGEFLVHNCRGWLINYKGTTKLYSRNYSDKDCSLLEYWQNIDQESSWNEGIYAVDVECKFGAGVDIRKDLEEIGLTTDSPLEAMTALLHTYPSEAKKIQQKYKALTGKDLIVFRLIHPLYFKGKNYITRPLGEGQDVYDECVEFGQSIGINIKPISRCAGTRVEKEMFLDTILNNGGEGIVFHNRKGSYCTSENRSKTSFIKLKRSVSSTMNKEGLGDTIDAFVTGYKLGKVGTANEGLISVLNVSIYVNNNGVLREHFIAAIPNIDLATKKRCTLNDASGLWPQEYVDSNGTTQVVSLSPEFGGLCMEVDGQALSSKSQRLEHPRMIRWRLDKIPEMCVYTQEFLDSQTTASVHNNGKIGYQSVD